MGIRPDLVVGDFDSLGYMPKNENIIYHKPEKDDTDMMMSVKEGLRRGYRRFIIYGGLGGKRFDHTYANIQTLAYIAEHGAVGYLVGENTVVTVLKNGKMEFEKGEKGIISVFCAGGRAEGVCIKGLKYPLENAEFTHDMPLGVSNEFSGVESSIEVKNGSLIIMWNGDIRKIISEW